MSKILISGTGRSGTTFLIKIFSFLGFDTGYNKENYNKYIYSNCNSGMESNYHSHHQVIKNPKFMEEIPNIIKNGISIKQMIIPIRNYNESAESRCKIESKSTNNNIKEVFTKVDNYHYDFNKEKIAPTTCGGLWKAVDKESQLLQYYKKMAEYSYFMVKYDIPTLFLDFDQMINNEDYLYNKLKPLLDEKKIDINQFHSAYTMANETSKPKV